MPDLFRADPSLQRRWALIAVVVLIVIGLVFHKVETLVAGLLGLIGGVSAYFGALQAADRQVAAAKDQVAAMQQQLADAQAARTEADERRLTVVKWAVRAEGRRLQSAIIARKDNALPSGQQYASRRRKQLVIASSSLLRGEREDLALLDGKTFALLRMVVTTLDDYNSRIETAVANDQGGPLVDRATLDAFDRLAGWVAKLDEV